MPYIITTERPSRQGGRVPGTVSRRAVATLEEACIVADSIVRSNAPLIGGTDWKSAAYAACHLPESGGTVGPLPDGTTIQVERVVWAYFGWKHAEPPTPDVAAYILDAFNARQS